jgi:hypothetical protein
LQDYLTSDRKEINNESKRHKVGGGDPTFGGDPTR